jgi:hypothetical protein
MPRGKVLDMVSHTTQTSRYCGAEKSQHSLLQHPKIKFIKPEGKTVAVLCGEPMVDATSLDPEISNCIERFFDRSSVETYQLVRRLLHSPPSSPTFGVDVTHIIASTNESKGFYQAMLEHERKQPAKRIVFKDHEEQKIWEELVDDMTSDSEGEDDETDTTWCDNKPLLII